CHPDLERTLTFVSMGCLALTGYQPAELHTSGTMAYQRLVHPDDRERVWQTIQTVFAERQRFQVVYRITTAHGETRWVWEQGCGVADPAGRLAALEGFITDATAQVAAFDQLEQRVAARTQELAILLQIATTIAATLDRETLVEVVLDQLKLVVDYGGAAVHVLEEGRLQLLGTRTPALAGRQRPGSARLPLEETGRIWAQLQAGQAVIVADMQQDPALRRAYEDYGAQLGADFRTLRAWMAVPLLRGERLTGLLILGTDPPGYYTSHHADLAQAVAGQVAVALENAQLVATLQAQAVADERQRLARELHDSVTQALFSASLMGEVLPELWERNPARGRQALDDLRRLTRGALAEMRTLLFELRPAALSEVPLGDLVRQLADAVSARSRLAVALDVHQEGALPSEVTLALYRIAQEGLNNSVKHARAARAELRLHADTAGVTLVIRDDGQGFDPAQLPPGHFGLGMLRERAALIGAALTIASAPGAGTTLTVVWHPQDNRDD
ncbi:MAG: PAS domain-containing protein, partial [Chloroflexales bacterium]|nr:PAS domain-containing protein [Chloroflexales bacterium]